MDAPLTSGITCLLDRLGEGHGRRALLLATGEDDTDVRLAIELAKRAWAVSARVPSQKVAATARALTEAAGVVVDWGTSAPFGDEQAVARFAVVASLGDPGLGDGDVGAGLSVLLQADGILLVVLAEGSAVPDVAGFSSVSVAQREGVVLIPARRIG